MPRATKRVIKTKLLSEHRKNICFHCGGELKRRMIEASPNPFGATESIVTECQGANGKGSGCGYLTVFYNTGFKEYAQ